MVKGSTRTNASTLPRRALGRQLRKLRERAGYTQSAASRVAEISPQSYGRIEDGWQTKVTDLGLNALANAYEATDGERRLLLDLAREIREATASGGGWWRAYADAMVSGFDHYLALEEAANWVTSWQTTVVPGLLQTRDYRQALTWALNPNQSSDDVNRTLDLAQRRQNLLDRPDFKFEAMLTEAVLRYNVGSSSVMADQVKHLLDRSDMPGVEVRIVPNTETSPVGLLSRSFVLFSFPPLHASKLQEPPVAYMEGFTGNLFVERDIEVAEYSREAERIRHVALSPSASKDLMLRISEE
ncbi:helix-turn-helix domain-containing protein [Nocardia speluncae]|uniref:Helix-turn-helix domain-containing protein n=1 Tax=Nocardia speluncae TaxID=419477 RepID=A0A846XM98_9NOCA|nr:helix-turn-helix transcriptional regulator [Nocardia speluncae]NKY36455.1 helix-turn-helix domain-containing protein [Nocardia speluncae]